MWCIWKLRCDVLFRHTGIDLPRVILNTKRMINSYISLSNPISVRLCDYKLQASEVNHFMFVDASYKNFKMGLGIIWYDCAENVNSSRANVGLISDAVGAEAAALILAFFWAEEMNLSNIVFVCDCLQLVHFVNGVSCNIEWQNGDLLEQCQSLFSRSLSYKLVYVKCRNNKLADRLARRARSDSLSGLWSPLPPFLTLLLRNEYFSDVYNSFFC